MNEQQPMISLTTWATLISGILLNAVALLMLKAATIRLGTLRPAENSLLHNTFRVVFQPYVME
jgi:hypothetical protein